MLDRAGWRILQALQQNARISYTELGQQVGLTPPAVTERIRRLEETGLITGYTATLSLEKLGIPITAFVRTTTFSETAYRDILDALANAPEVLELHHITGEEDNIAKIVASSIEHLEKILARFARYGKTTTSIVLSSRVGNRIIGPDNIATPNIEEDRPRH